jgi:hypothetical protein
MPLAKATTPHSLRARAGRPVLRARPTVWAVGLAESLALCLALCVVLAQSLALRHAVDHAMGLGARHAVEPAVEPAVRPAVGPAAQLQLPQHALALPAKNALQTSHGTAGAHDTDGATCLLLDQLLALHPGRASPCAASPPLVASHPLVQPQAAAVAAARHTYLARGPPGA